MNRRNFLKMAGFAVATTSAGLVADTGTLISKTRKTEKPNVLFIISDDLCVALKAMDNPQCNTPNLDKLAANGIRFDRAYCQWPVCGPSRASIMTGLYDKALGITTNTSSFRGTAPNIVTMPQLFKNNSYHSARVSKIYHMGVPGTIMSGGSGNDDAASWNETKNVKASEQYTEPYIVNESQTPQLSQGMNFHNVTVADEDVMKLADKMAADEALKIIDARKDESFFLAVGMVRPHVPFVVPDTIFDEYPYPDMELPYVEPGDLDDVPDIAEWESNANKYHMTGDEPQKAIQGYYASVTFMDQQVGRVLDKLEEYNLDNNTIIVFTSDHGYQLGQHTFWQKQSLFENAVRVPLIISSPFHKDTAGQRCNEVVELLDVYPTVADLAGLTWPEYLHGVSLKPLLAQPDGTGWTDKVAYTVTINGGKSIRTDRYRYNTWSNGAKELYDHDTDPDEFTNQADNPDYAADLASLDAILQTKITESGIIDPPAS